MRVFQNMKTSKIWNNSFSSASYKEHSICVFHLTSPARCNYLKIRSVPHASGRHLIISTFKEYINAQYHFWRVHEYTKTPQPYATLVFPTACLLGPGVMCSSESKPSLMVRHMLSLSTFSISRQACPLEPCWFPFAYCVNVPKLETLIIHIQLDRLVTSKQFQPTDRPELRPNIWWNLRIVYITGTKGASVPLKRNSVDDSVFSSTFLLLYYSMGLFI